MTVELAPPLAEQRRVLRAQLVAQRQRLTRQLAPDGAVHGGFPRSVTMRWLIREPELALKLLERVVGGRVAAAVPALLIFARRFVRSATV